MSTNAEPDESMSAMPFGTHMFRFAVRNHSGSMVSGPRMEDRTVSISSLNGGKWISWSRRMNCEISLVYRVIRGSSSGQNGHIFVPGGLGLGDLT